MVKSQQEVSAKFMPILNSEGKRYRKTASAFVRKGVQGETITTVLFGQKETEQTIQNDDSYVACGQSFFELYVMKKEEFEKNYDSSAPMEIDIDLPPYQNLKKRGFKEYLSRRKVLAYQVNAEDIKWFDADDKSPKFIAPVRI